MIMSDSGNVLCFDIFETHTLVYYYVKRYFCSFKKWWEILIQTNGLFKAGFD